VPSSATLNYVGVALAFLSTFIYVFVKTDADTGMNAQVADKTLNEIKLDTVQVDALVTETKANEKTSLIKKANKNRKRIFGYLLASFSGLMFGEAFVPIIYVGQQENNKNYLDYLFSYYSGILIGSLLIFIVYCAFKKNKPVLPTGVVLPGLLSGKNIKKNISKLNKINFNDFFS
jgi:hypothetical protein